MGSVPASEKANAMLNGIDYRYNYQAKENSKLKTVDSYTVKDLTKALSSQRRRNEV